MAAPGEPSVHVDGPSDQSAHMQQKVEPEAKAARIPVKLELNLAKLPESVDMADPIGDFFVQLSKRFTGATSEHTSKGGTSHDNTQPAVETVDSAVQGKAAVAAEEVDPSTQTTPPSERHALADAGVMLEGVVEEPDDAEAPIRRSRRTSLDPNRRRRIARALWQKAYLVTSLVEVHEEVKELGAAAMKIREERETLESHLLGVVAANGARRAAQRLLAG